MKISRISIAVAVPLLSTIVASLGRAGATARDVADLGTARRPTSSPRSWIAVPDVHLAQLRPAQADREPRFVRNPFGFAPRNLPPTPVPLSVPMAVTPEAPPDIPASLALSLIGVATTTRADGRAERTAIITGPIDTLYMVREADAVAARYRVEAILPDSVLLADNATGAPLRLMLR